MVGGGACYVGPGEMVDSGILYLKEGEVCVACEVKLGVDLGGVESDWEKGLDAFDFIQEVKVRGGGGDRSI